MNRQRQAEQKRRNDAGVAGDDRHVDSPAQQPGIEFQSHEEHEQKQSDLAQGVHCAKCLRREKGSRKRRQRCAQ